MEPVTLPRMIYRPGQTAAIAPGGCWTCSAFDGETVARRAHVICRRDGRVAVIATPGNGCAFWLREPGAD